LIYEFIAVHQETKENLKIYLEKIKQLEKQILEIIKVQEDAAIAKCDADQKPAVEITGGCQQIYEDLESGELNAGSNMITITAEVHSHEDPAAASLDSNTNSTTRKPQSCVFGDSLEDITMIE